MVLREKANLKYNMRQKYFTISMTLMFSCSIRKKHETKSEDKIDFKQQFDEFVDPSLSGCKNMGC